MSVTLEFVCPVCSETMSVNVLLGSAQQVGATCFRHLRPTAMVLEKKEGNDGGEG